MLHSKAHLTIANHVTGPLLAPNHPRRHGHGHLPVPGEYALRVHRPAHKDLQGPDTHHHQIYGANPSGLDVAGKLVLSDLHFQRLIFDEFHEMASLSSKCQACVDTFCGGAQH